MSNWIRYININWKQKPKRKKTSYREHCSEKKKRKKLKKKKNNNKKPVPLLQFLFFATSSYRLCIFLFKRQIIY